MGGQLLHHQRNPWNKDEVFNIFWQHTFWTGYKDHVSLLVLKLHEALKRNYSACMKITPIACLTCSSAMMRKNYTRYLAMAMFSSMISSIEITQTESNDALKHGAFSVACLMIHGGHADVDKTMDETFMQNCEFHRRATGAYMPGITQNHAAYQRLVKTIHACGLNIYIKRFY